MQKFMGPGSRRAGITEERRALEEGQVVLRVFRGTESQFHQTGHCGSTWPSCTSTTPGQHSCECSDTAPIASQRWSSKFVGGTKAW